MSEFLDFFNGQEVDKGLLVFLMLFGCGIALFHTLILSLLYSFKLRPRWIMFVIDPAIIGLAYLVKSGYALLALVVLFASVFVFGIIGMIYHGIRGTDEDRAFNKAHPKPLWKKILGVIAFLLFIPFFLGLGPYAFILVFGVAILRIAILPNPKNRFKKYQAILPTSKIRSVAMGLAEVQGKIVAKELLKAPIDSLPCVGYHYTIEDISRDKDGRDSYSQIHSETRCADFFIQDDTGSISVSPEKIEFIWVEMDGRYSNGSKRYTQYLLKANDEVLIIGKASVKEGQPVMEHENIKNVFGIAPVDKVNHYNKYKPLLNSFILFSCVVAFFIAMVLVSQVQIVGDRVVVSLNAAVFSWDGLLSNF